MGVFKRMSAQEEIEAPMQRLDRMAVGQIVQQGEADAVGLLRGHLQECAQGREIGDGRFLPSKTPQAEEEAAEEVVAGGRQPLTQPEQVAGPFEDVRGLPTKSSSRQAAHGRPSREHAKVILFCLPAWGASVGQV